MGKKTDSLLFSLMLGILRVFRCRWLNWPAYRLECPLPFIVSIDISQYGYYLLYDILSKADSPDKKMTNVMGTSSVPITT